MNDEVLKALQHKQQTIPKLPGDSPNLVNRFTQADGGKTYGRFEFFAGYNNSEGVTIWKDNLLYPSGTSGFSIIASMVNAALYDDTKDKVVGLCAYNATTKVFSSQDIPAGTNELHLSFGDSTSSHEKPSFLNLLDKKPCSWKPTASLISFEDLVSRYTLGGVFNEPYTALPPAGSTVGVRERGTCGITDYWEPEMVGKSGAPFAAEVVEGDMLQFQPVVKMRLEKTTRRPIYYYQFVPTLNSRPRKPLKAKDAAGGDVLIYSPPHFLDVAVVHQQKTFNKTNVTPRHTVVGEDSATFTEFVSPKIHVRLCVSH
jgi:hypothetical protein